MTPVELAELREAPELWVPVERIQPIVARYKPSRRILSVATQRRLHDIKHGNQAFVSLTVVDRILYEMGLEHWLRIRQEDGGLDDIYADGKQYGNPNSIGGQAKARKAAA